MMLGFLSNMKSKLMVVEAFALFVPTTIASDGRRYAIAAHRESHNERNLMRNFLAFVFFLIEVVVSLPYSLLLI